ncbi:site-specific DNA-methyltransferase [Candidatus Poribacteria bacterium]|nr:MAG: site-specific DNA-methyltransferase [Candidatus Poribacteria bacterium]
MARNPRTQPYQHETETRTNNPSVGLSVDGDIAEMPQTTYYYNPHLQPSLRSADTDPVPSHVKSLLSKAQQEPLTTEETQQLADALHAQPWLEWANKREGGDFFTVDPVPLFIHERLSAQAILETAKRNDIQRDLFADPQQKYRDAVRFYEHEVPWSNRLILGDSLQVMDSLANREGLAGQVQMIYVDPPYGINFRSNFQPDVFRTKIGDGDKDLTREMEQVKAYRDTWKLGIHSYLSYLRNRFVLARELLLDSGSIFVQISDDNAHRVRCLLDEVFGPENFVAEIVFRTRTTSKSKYLTVVNDFILWYAKDREQLKFRRLFVEKEMGARFSKAELPTGEIISTSRTDDFPEGTKFFTHDDLRGGASPNQPFTFRNKKYNPTSRGGWRCTLDGLSRLEKAERLIPQRSNIGYKYYFSDFPYSESDNLWNELLYEQDKSYVVQTNATVIQRCMLMSTDPGDLILDPTCGSGTTAYVAEQWGRRWITIDTSRIAITIARNRLLSATYDYYKLKDKSVGIAGGLLLETSQHIKLSDIANNVALDPIFAKHDPILAEKLMMLNGELRHVTPEIRQKLQQKLAAKKSREITDTERRRWNLPETAWEEWEVPFDTDQAWPEALQAALIAYREAWRVKMDEVNTCITESTIQEDLVDRPIIDKNLLRVSGPFTIESVQPPAQSLDTEAIPVTLDREPANAAAYLEQMYSLLKTSGIDFENEKKNFSRLNRIEGDIFHVEGQFEDDDREVGIVFGPQHGPVTALQVEDCLREARRIYNVLLFAGFHFEAEAQAIIQDEHRHLQTHLTQIAPDVVMRDLLRQTDSDRLFTVIGAPRTEVKRAEDGQFRVRMEGIDAYNPVDNTIEPTEASQVAAWFLDADYDGRTFCPTQSFFPNRNAWQNIARSLREVIDEENLAAFSGTESLPFTVGKHNRIAVKVIDRRGNELMCIHKLGDRDG